MGLIDLFLIEKLLACSVCLLLLIPCCWATANGTAGEYPGNGSTTVSGTQHANNELWERAFVVGPEPIAFSVGPSRRYSLTGRQKTMRLTFDDIRVNNGGVYSASTGMFTVPVTGTYMFTCNIRSVPGTLALVHIMVGDQKVHSVWANGRNSGDYGTGTGTVAQHLRRGHYVYLMLEQYNGNVHVDKDMSMFTGHRLT